jgi:hypothetical protein
VTAIVIGLFLFIEPQVLGLTGNAAVAIPVAIIAVGVGVLIWRMQDGPRPDDDPDDGAVV